MEKVVPFSAPSDTNYHKTIPDLYEILGLPSFVASLLFRISV
jgi:hypothetical protein